MAHLLHFTHFRPPLSASLRPKSATAAAYRDLPARDRLIDFGKHKGRMLGSLPSSYLKWVSKTLRARDFEEWARLADEVLADPVYRDRLEWEAAERVLSGGGGSVRQRGSETPASDLIDISERFGWDNEDKEAWARLDFELLGTSNGGQIPRLQKSGKEANFADHSKPTLSGTSMASSPRRTRWPEKEGKDEIFNANATSSSNLRLNQIAKSKKEETFVSNKRISHGGRNGVLSKEANFDSVVANSTKPSHSKPTLSETSMASSPRRSRWPEKEGKDGILNSNLISSSDLRLNQIAKSKKEETLVRKFGALSKGQRYIVGGEEEMMMEKCSREERREMRRWKREQQMEDLRREVGVQEKKSGEDDDEISRGRRKKMGFVAGINGGGESLNPFPGRKSLLEKIKETKRL